MTSFILSSHDQNVGTFPTKKNNKNIFKNINLVTRISILKKNVFKTEKIALV